MLISRTSSWSEVRNLLSLSAHPQSCVWMSKEFCYHHHTHGQGRPRSPIRQRQCNYNCLQNTRRRPGVRRRRLQQQQRLRRRRPRNAAAWRRTGLSQRGACILKCTSEMLLLPRVIPSDMRDVMLDSWQTSIIIRSACIITCLSAN